LDGTDNGAYHTVTQGIDSTYFDINRPNGTGSVVKFVFESDTSGSSGSDYTLPIASASTLGGVKIGSGLSIDGSGVLSTTGGSIPSLQQVTNVGNITTKSIYVDSLVGTSDASINTLRVGSGGHAGATFFGYQAGLLATNRTTAVGYQASKTNTTTINSAFGYQALALNTGGNNSAFGYNTLALSTSGSNNTAVGNSAMWITTTASNNTAIGSGAMQVDTSGSNNTAIGASALISLKNGFNNTAVGFSSFSGVTTGSSNSGLGASVGIRTTTGSANIALGDSALYSNITGSYNIGIGYAAITSATTNSNSIAIGTNAIAASNQLAFSDSLTSIKFPQIATAIGTTGAQTINKAVGSVNFAAGQSSLVVTNSSVTTASQIMVTVYGTDATATFARVTRALGSFTITLNSAATSETAVGFLIIN